MFYQSWKGHANCFSSSQVIASEKSQKKIMIERNRRITRESSLETEDPNDNLKKGKQ